jgi:hypothetical protein
MLESIDMLLQTKDSADKMMSYLTDCVFCIKNVSKQESDFITKVIALGGGCILSGIF